MPMTKHSRVSFFLLSFVFILFALSEKSSEINSMTSTCVFRGAQLRVMWSLYLHAFISVHLNDAKLGWLQLTGYKTETLTSIA